jgi:hypothetical protein
VNPRQVSNTDVEKLNKGGGFGGGKIERNRMCIVVA